MIEKKIRKSTKLKILEKLKKKQIGNLKKNLNQGIITHELINRIINIFEINLMVFDISKSQYYFYWSCGTKYPSLNLFQNIYCMSYIQGKYEPIMPIDSDITIEQQKKLYLKIC